MISLFSCVTQRKSCQIIVPSQCTMQLHFLNYYISLKILYPNYMMSIVEIILHINFKLYINLIVILIALQITENTVTEISFSFLGKRWYGFEGKLAFLSLNFSFQGCDNFPRTFRSRMRKGYSALSTNTSKSLRYSNFREVKMKVFSCFLLDEDEFFHPLMCQTQLKNVSFNFPAGEKHLWAETELGEF